MSYGGCVLGMSEEQTDRQRTKTNSLLLTYLINNLRIIRLSSRRPSVTFGIFRARSVSVRLAKPNCFFFSLIQKLKKTKTLNCFCGILVVSKCIESHKLWQSLMFCDVPSHTDPNGKRWSSLLLLWWPPQANATFASVCCCALWLTCNLTFVVNETLFEKIYTFKSPQHFVLTLTMGF